MLCLVIKARNVGRPQVAVHRNFHLSYIILYNNKLHCSVAFLFSSSLFLLRGFDQQYIFELHISSIGDLDVSSSYVSLLSLRLK